MNSTEYRKICNTAFKEAMNTEITLFQRSLTTESQQWLRQVENRAKQLKTGKVVLIAQLIEE